MVGETVFGNSYWAYLWLQRSGERGETTLILLFGRRGDEVYFTYSQWRAVRWPTAKMKDVKLESDWSGLDLQPFVVGDRILQCILWWHWLSSQNGSFRKHEEALILNIQVRCRTSWRTAHGAKLHILQYDSLMHCYLGTNRPFDPEPHEGRAQDPLRFCVV